MIGRLLGFPASAARPRPRAPWRPSTCPRPTKKVKAYSGHAPAPGPGGLPGGTAPVPVPGRAHHGSGPRRPPGAVVDDPGTGGRRHHGAADHAIPGGSGPAGRRDRGHRPGPGHRRAPVELKTRWAATSYWPARRTRRTCPPPSASWPRCRRLGEHRDGQIVTVRINDRSALGQVVGAWTMPGSPWTTCRCAVPAWTRCSWPSPATSRRKRRRRTIRGRSRA